MSIFNPCNKCIVRACCTAICEPSMKWNRIYNFIIEPLDLIEDLYKDGEWVLLSVMSFLMLALVAGLAFWFTKGIVFLTMLLKL